MSDWQILPRDGDRLRELDPVSGWAELVLVERYGTHHSWTLTGPAAALGDLGQPGMGCVLLADDEQVTSGQLTSIQRGAQYDGSRLVETMTLTFTSDRAALGGRIVYPSPAHVLSTAISKFPAAYDSRKGPAEDVILGYIAANIGPAAQVWRPLHNLRLPTSLGRGPVTPQTARLDNLGALVDSLQEAANLLVDIVHTEDAGGTWLDLVVREVADLSADVRFGTAESTATGLITDWSYELSAPTATRVIAGLGGELADREFLKVEDAGAEFLWRSTAELFLDQRNIAPDSEDKLEEATREAGEALAAAIGPTKVEFTPILGPDLAWRKDLRIGDIVGYDLPGLESGKDKIREATTTVSVQSGEATERVSVVVGTPDAAPPRSHVQLTKALRAINVIQRSK